MILEKGILAGRKVFGNTMKYIKATTSSNFGNVFSVLVASIFFPFLPLLPFHFLFLGLFFKFLSFPIPWIILIVDFFITPKNGEQAVIKNFSYRSCQCYPSNFYS